jgi:hypothetical protein
MPDNDVYWTSHTRETCDQLSLRIDEFLHWLVQQNEQSIVVVTHGVFLEVLLEMYLPQMLQSGHGSSGGMRERRRVHNLDTFVCLCVSEEIDANLYRNSCDGLECMKRQDTQASAFLGGENRVGEQLRSRRFMRLEKARWVPR